MDKIVWQPRIYYWFNGNGLPDPSHEGIPAQYTDKSMLDVYDLLNASPRYPQEVLGIPLFHIVVDDKHVQSSSQTELEETTYIHATPKGTLTETSRSGYHTEYPVKTLDDIPVMEYILDHSEFVFDRDNFEQANRMFGDRGVVQTFYPRSPLQRLFISYMGWENTIYLLHDSPQEIEQFLKVIEEWDDKMYQVLLDSPIQILNFGENIDAHIDAPRLFEQYLMPYYDKRIKQVHQKGKFCHIHMDGALKPLLPFLKYLDFDGIEAATPLPQGDVTLEELKEAMGEKILLDGIPAIMFLEQYTLDELAELAIKVLDMFSPHLILGASDEVPPPADIERVRFVAEIVDNYQPQ